MSVSELQADFLGGAHGFEHADDDLRSASAVRFVAGFRFQQFRVGEDDPELIAEAMEEQP